jgi:hypothetical protein
VVGEATPGEIIKQVAEIDQMEAAFDMTSGTRKKADPAA